MNAVTQDRKEVIITFEYDYTYKTYNAHLPKEILPCGCNISRLQIIKYPDCYKLFTIEEELDNDDTMVVTERILISSGELNQIKKEAFAWIRSMLNRRNEL
jgi:hypothetical protein